MIGETPQSSGSRQPLLSQPKVPTIYSHRLKVMGDSAEVEALRRDAAVWDEPNWRSMFSLEVTDNNAGTLAFRYDDDYKRPAPLVSALSAAYPRLCFEHEYLDEFASVMRREMYSDGVCVEELDLEPADMEWVDWEDEE